MDVREYESQEMGVRFEIDASFTEIARGRPEDETGEARPAQALPAAHFIAAPSGSGWIAALAAVTVESAPQAPAVWLSAQLSRARSSFAEWPPQAAELLTPPEASELAGRPALHVSYRLHESQASGDNAGVDRASGTETAPSSHVEHWTVLVVEHAWLMVMELMVQPPECWDDHRTALGLPFTTLAFI
jgi:hypothetical protein